jgi:hypothetical protein
MRGELFVCGCLTVLLTCLFLTGRHSPTAHDQPAWALIGFFSGDRQAQYHTESAWFKKEWGAGLVAFGFFNATPAHCTVKWRQEDEFANVARAFAKAVHCYPSARFVGIFRDSAVLHPPKLMARVEASHSAHYFGTPTKAGGLTYANWEEGFVLSRAAVEWLGNCSVGQPWSEFLDVGVGECMLQRGWGLRLGNWTG